MKKIILPIFFAVTCGQVAFANDNDFTFSIHLDAGATSTFGKDADEAFDLTGSSIFIGPGFQFQLSSPVSIILNPGFQLDMLESSKDNKDDEQLFEFDFIYLNLPLLVRFNIGKAFAEIGPQLNLNLYSEASYNDNDPKKIEFMNDYELAISTGVGYRFKFGLELNGRFQLGLSNIFNNTTMNDDVMKWTLAGGVSYWFLH